MAYSEFSENLKKILAEAESEKFDIKTVEDLEKFVATKVRKPKRSGARSLRGLSF